MNMKLLFVAICTLLVGQAFAVSCDHELTVPFVDYVDGFVTPDDKTTLISLYLGDTQVTGPYDEDESEWRFKNLCPGHYVLNSVSGITSYGAYLDNGNSVVTLADGATTYEFDITEGDYKGLPIPDNYCGFFMDLYFDSCGDGTSPTFTVTKDSDGSTVISESGYFSVEDLCGGSYKVTVDGNGQDILSGGIRAATWPYYNRYDAFDYEFTGESVSICFTLPYSSDSVSVCEGSATVYDDDFCGDSSGDGDGDSSGSDGGDSGSDGGDSSGNHQSGDSSSGSSSGDSNSESSDSTSTNGSSTHQISLVAVVVLALLCLS